MYLPYPKTKTEITNQKPPACVGSSHVPSRLSVNKRRTDAMCRELLRKYAPSRIQEFASDDWQSYQKAIPAELHRVGKDATQRIERVNLNFRTHLKRLHRRTICYSKSEQMHDAVIKLYVHEHNQTQHQL